MAPLNHRADLIHRGGNLALATRLRRHVVAIDASNEWVRALLPDVVEGLLPDLAQPQAQADVARIFRHPRRHT
jgi:hypothetical protein